MEELIINYTYLILLLPLWLFLIIMIGRFFSIYVNKHLINFLTLFSSFIGVLISGFSLLKIDNPIDQTFRFIQIKDFIIDFGIRVDKLSLSLTLLLFLISFCVQLFSINYMKEVKKSYRFFALLNLFNFSMSSLLFSPNLFQLYIFWELIGVISYLLIGFKYQENQISEVSKRVFLINRFGDTLLLSGIIFISYFMYNYGGNLSFAMLSFEDMNIISTLLYAYTSTEHFYIINILLLIACFIKSAQVPFYTWLQDAMKAELPVSALLHSATLVVAGIYLAIRLLPILSMENNLLNIIEIVGFITALVCSILACTENNVKKVLAYSTSANLGLMFVGLSYLDIKVVLIYIVAHGLIKSMLFLSTSQKENYVGFITFLLGALSLSGIIFSGMVAKEMIYGIIEINIYLAILYCLISFLNAFYILRIALIMLNEKSLKNKITLQHIPIGILLLGNILFYFLLKNLIKYEIKEPFMMALVGWFIVFILYKYNLLEKFQYNKKFLADIYEKFLPKCYKYATNILNIFEQKYLCNYQPILSISKLSVKFVDKIEKNIMNGLVNLTTNSFKKFSELDMKAQSGNIQTYNAYALTIFTIIMGLVLLIYIKLFSQYN